MRTRRNQRKFQNPRTRAHSFGLELLALFEAMSPQTLLFFFPLRHFCCLQIVPPQLVMETAFPALPGRAGSQVWVVLASLGSGCSFPPPLP